MIKQLFFLGLAIAAQFVLTPAFITMSVARGDKEMLIRFGIVIAVWLLCNLVLGRMK